MRGVDAQLHAFDSPAARAGARVARRHVRYERTALRHAIHIGIRKMYTRKKLLYLVVERRSAHYQFLHLASERSHKRCTHTRHEARVYARHAQQHAHYAFFKHRKDTCAYHLFEHKRNSSDKFRLYFRHSLHYNTRCRRTRQERHMATHAYGIEQLYGQSVHMRKRKQAYHRITCMQASHPVAAEHHIAPQRAVRQRHSFAETCRPARVIDKHQV